MNTWYKRVYNVLYTTLIAIIASMAIVAVVTYLHPTPATTSELTLSSAAIYKHRDAHVVQVGVSGRLRNFWNVNTKQFFLMVAADYETPRPGGGLWHHNVAIIDNIMTTPESADFTSLHPHGMSKYLIRGPTGRRLVPGYPASLTAHLCRMPWTGGFQWSKLATVPMTATGSEKWLE